jgi:hypothetical protein
MTLMEILFQEQPAQFPHHLQRVMSQQTLLPELRTHLR